MRLAIRVLGYELLAIETTHDEEPDDTARDLSGGTTLAYPIGFAPSPGDQRWEAGSEL